MKRKIGCLFIVLCILTNINAQNFLPYASAVWIENNGNGQFYNTYSISTTTSGRTLLILLKKMPLNKVVEIGNQHYFKVEILVLMQPILIPYFSEELK